MKKIVRIGNVELLPEEAEKLYDERKYIVAYGAIYRLQKSAKRGVYGVPIAKRKHGNIGFAKRGRYHVMDLEDVERMLKGVI